MSAAEPIDDQPLRRDVRTLGFELGRVIRGHTGEATFDLVERIRRLAQRRRAGSDQADRELREAIGACGLDELESLIRALSCFFDLANLSEDRHRIRVLRQREAERHPAPRNESIGAAVDAMAEAGASADEVQGLLDELAIEPVFTAHPTEAKRRTVRHTLRRLRRNLLRLDAEAMLPRERNEMLSDLKANLACLWETDALRPRRPTVLEEVRRSLFVAESLWEVAPRLRREMRNALARAYPEASFRIPAFLRFGSWIGGDRDGNPFVTAEVTAETLKCLRATALEKHLSACGELEEILTVSDRYHRFDPSLEAMVDNARTAWPQIEPRLEALNPHEKYRHCLAVIRYRLERTAEATPEAPLPAGAYGSAEGLSADLNRIVENLRRNGHDRLADGKLQDWVDRVTVFGFHLARLDVREDARALSSAVGELMRALGRTGDWSGLGEDERQRLLLTAPSPAEAGAVDLEALSAAARSSVDVFLLLERAAGSFDRAALGTLIASMTHAPSDCLALMWLERFAAARLGHAEPPAPLPIVPLFETIDDLERSEQILEGLLRLDAYRGRVAAHGDEQICMVGYSDSTKDGGYLAANWHLHRAQQRLSDVAARHGVKLTFFHGRGGALGRGGGPAARSIRSLPPAAVQGRLRMTEQGEVLAERYDDPEIAFRHLEQVTWATMLVSRERRERVDESWRSALDRASEVSRQRYESLKADPGFLAYFDEATPIRTIESMPIGSRPSRRRGARRLADLRAIPYTFAWTQSRHMVTAFFGLGSGLEAAAEAIGWDGLGQMYRTWPPFRALIDNCELALTKADLSIAQRYAELAADPEAGARIWSRIRDELHRSRRAVLAIAGREELLDATPWLQRSIRVRNPYVDPLNLIQIELLSRIRADPEGPDAQRIHELLCVTVQGVAAGLRTTG